MATMARLCLFALLSVLFIQWSNGQFMWNKKSRLSDADLQIVPPKSVTARKMAKNLLGRWGSFGGPNAKNRGRSQNSDVVYIIDDSGSILHSNFTLGLQALRLLIDRHSSGDNYAAVKFSSTAQILFNFVSSSQAKQNLMSVSYTAGGTYTARGLQLAREGLFQNPNSGIRSGSTPVAVVITDGRSNINEHRTIPEANALKAFGVQVFVIAVGNYIPGIGEIANVASTRDFHLFRVKSMGAFVDVVKLIP